MDKPSNPSAFPSPSQGYIKEDGQHAFRMASRGMTLRDWFAGQIISGLASQHDGAGTWSWAADDAVNRAYAIAHAMLVERERYQ